MRGSKNGENKSSLGLKPQAKQMKPLVPELAEGRAKRSRLGQKEADFGLNIKPDRASFPKARDRKLSGQVIKSRLLPQIFTKSLPFRDQTVTISSPNRDLLALNYVTEREPRKGDQRALHKRVLEQGLFATR